MEEYSSIQPNWQELFVGPIFYRRAYKDGKYFEAESIHTLIEKYQYSDACRMSIGLHDGLLRFEWVQNYGTFEPLHTYDDFIDCYLEYDRNSPENLTYRLGDFPESMNNEALKVMQGAIDFCSRLMQEFKNALNEGSCQVWARFGGDAVPFRQISPELFNKYKIKSWGRENKVGQALAVREFEPSLFAIQVSLNNYFKKGNKIQTSGLAASILKPDLSEDRPLHDDKRLIKKSQLQDLSKVHQEYINFAVEYISSLRPEDLNKITRSAGRGKQYIQSTVATKIIKRHHLHVKMDTVRRVLSQHKHLWDTNHE